MSDTFDHALDAYESLLHDDTPSYDSLWHHTRFTAKQLAKTNKAILFEDDFGKFWVPKKLLRKKGKDLYIWEGFEPSYIKEDKPKALDFDVIDLSAPVKKPKVVIQSTPESKKGPILKAFEDNLEERAKADKLGISYAEYCAMDLPF